MNGVDLIELYLPPFPIYRVSDYRRFAVGERHITRWLDDEYVLLIMFDGELNFTEEGEQVCLVSGEWYIQRPYMYQSAVEESRVPQYYYVHFIIPQYDEDAYQMLSAEKICLPIRGKCNFEIYEPYLRALSSPRNGSVLEKLDRQRLFLEFFTLFLRTSGCHGIRLLSPLARRISDAVKATYFEPRAASLLYEKFNYSPEHLRKVFLRETGSPVNAFINGLRIERACVLLANTDSSIEEISHTVGFTDVSVFFRNFKKLRGVNPSGWRQAIRFGSASPAETEGISADPKEL